MINPLRAVHQALQENGLRYTLSEMVFQLSDLPAGILFGIYDAISTEHKRDVVSVVRSNQPEADTYAMLDEIKGTDVDRTLHVFYRTPVHESQFETWSGDNDATISRVHSISSFRALLKSKYVFCKYDSHLRWYRFFDQSDRKYIRLYHGPITKAYGNSRTQSDPFSLTDQMRLFDNSPPYRSVASDVERFFRSSSEGRHPQRFIRLGYPRFDRLRRLKENDAKPRISDRVRNKLAMDGDYFNILYAPTRKDGAYPTTFFPYPDFELSQLRKWCRANNTRIFLRPHPKEDILLDHLVDGKTILFAGQEFVNSTSELMPFMDALITDYSSVYIEFLVFDRPIIFVKDRHSHFDEIRGLAFDFDTYFPGPKPDTFHDFLRSLEDAMDGSESYENDRTFVRKTFLPPTDRTFFEGVQDYFSKYK